MTSETPAKLPVWKTVFDCYRLNFHHPGFTGLPEPTSEAATPREP